MSAKRHTASERPERPALSQPPGRHMIEFNPMPSDERIVDTMVQLARATTTHRIIIAGNNSDGVFLELHRRGYAKITTTKGSRAPCGQHDVAFLASNRESIEELEAILDHLVYFLSASGVLVVWVGPHERMPDRKLRITLAKLGFRIESGTICENGVAIAARRLETNPVAKAA
jgi:hypothetical protein